MSIRRPEPGRLHDERMTQPSACRWCGVTCRDSDRLADWRCCRTCGPITTAVRAGEGHGALWRAVLRDPSVTEAEGTWLTRSGGNPAFYTTATSPDVWWSGGARKPWTHVPPARITAAREALRIHRDGTSSRAHPDGPCTTCGRRQDDSWASPPTEAPGVVCGACATALARYGWPARGTTTRADVITATALGAPVLIGIGDLTVRTHAEHHPGCAGHDTAWAHIAHDDRTEARLRLAVSSAEMRRRLTADERATLTARQAAAPADTPVPAVAL